MVHSHKVADINVFFVDYPPMNMGIVARKQMEIQFCKLVDLNGGRNRRDVACVSTAWITESSVKGYILDTTYPDCLHGYGAHRLYRYVCHMDSIVANVSLATSCLIHPTCLGTLAALPLNSRMLSAASLPSSHT